MKKEPCTCTSVFIHCAIIPFVRVATFSCTLMNYIEDSFIKSSSTWKIWFGKEFHEHWLSFVSLIYLCHEVPNKMKAVLRCLIKDRI